MVPSWRRWRGNSYERMRSSACGKAEMQMVEAWTGRNFEAAVVSISYTSAAPSK